MKTTLKKNLTTTIAERKGFCSSKKHGRPPSSAIKKPLKRALIKGRRFRCM